MNNLTPLSFRVIYDCAGKMIEVCSSDFIESCIKYCKTESRYHHDTFFIQKWIDGEFIDICNYFDGTEIPF